MKFDRDRTSEQIGERAGFFGAYLVFTTILFFILTYLGKLPEGWSYFHVAGLVFAIAAIGVELKDILK